MQGKIEINGCGINYRIDGPDGAPGVVFGNSLATNYGMWDPTVPALTDKYRVLRMDKRGHGGSDAGDTDVSIPSLADDVVALADALGFTGGHYVGLSIGGMIGQAIGMNHPNAFKSLALCATTSQVPTETHHMWEDRIGIAENDGMGPLVKPTLERWFSAPYREAHPDAVAGVGEMVAATSVTGYVRCCRAIMGMAFTDKIGAISTPTIVMPGELDPALPVPMSEVIASKIPGAKLAVVGNAAHLCNVEQPGTFNGILREWLDANEG
ncbi:MAG: 3-oxoadipate enol-lactonase [Rhodospirillaceae bacterium]